MEQSEHVEEQVQPNYEELAKEMGWSPKEEFRGAEDKFIPAKDFVERANYILPIVKKDRDKAREELREVKSELAKNREITQKMLKIQQKVVEDGYTTKLETIRNEKRKAVEEGNTELYDRLDAQEKKIEPPEKIEIEESKPETNTDIPEGLQKWIGENEWFVKDPNLARHARAYGEMLLQDEPALAVKGKEYEFAQKVKENMMRDMPHKFSNPAQQQPDLDEPSTRGVEIPKGKKGWNDLPEEAKRQCANLESQGILTKAQYIKDYFEE